MPKKTAPPNTTIGRRMPGAFEGETVTRRRFMTLSAHGAGAVAASAFLLPALGFALGPIFEEQEQKWQAVGPVGDFSNTTYTPKVMTVAQGIGETGKTTVYIRRRNPELDKEKLPAGFEFEEFVAISTRCMHLGCPVRFVQAAQRFICPCHGGVYNFSGEVDGGPPVRPLDRFYTRVREGILEVGPRFSVNSKLERFSPRDPGEPLDGIGHILYPSRPSIRKLSTGQE